MQCIRKVGLVPIVAVLMMGISHAQSNDLNAEVIEWVIDPCMQVAAAIEVNTYDQETLGLGCQKVTHCRAHVVK